MSDEGQTDCCLMVRKESNKTMTLNENLSKLVVEQLMLKLPLSCEHLVIWCGLEVEVCCCW